MSAPKTPEISRSPGLPASILGQPAYFVAGGGYRGTTADLDATVARAAELLRDAYGMDVTIRFNSDRKSGGAFLVTSETDGFGYNAEIGICASIAFRDEDERARYIERTRQRWADHPTIVANSIAWAESCEPGKVSVQAHIGAFALTDKSLASGYEDDPARGYYHGEAATIEDALAFVQANGSLERVREWQALTAVAHFLVKGGETLRAAKTVRPTRSRRAR